MKQMSCALLWAGVSMAALGAQAPATKAPDAEQAAPTEVRGGSVTFDVATNVFAISVHGESKALQGKVQVREGAEGLRLEQLEAVVPVDSLNTGMKLRDGHMRKYIFQTPEGQVPDVRFTAEHAECSPARPSGQSTCMVSGALAIRGTPRPFVIELSVTKDHDLFRVRGDGIVRLSTYGIERPSQLGVQTADVVKLHLELSARNAAMLSSSTKR
jgi:polyisoprenoid-binding protein YceI